MEQTNCCCNLLLLLLLLLLGVGMGVGDLRGGLYTEVVHMEWQGGDYLRRGRGVSTGFVSLLVWVKFAFGSEGVKEPLLYNKCVTHLSVRTEETRYSPQYLSALRYTHWAGHCYGDCLWFWSLSHPDQDVGSELWTSWPSYWAVGCALESCPVPSSLFLPDCTNHSDICAFEEASYPDLAVTRLKIL